MMNNHFADIILPFAVRGIFTYRIPEELYATVIPGVRVLVQFGNKKLYSGVVSNIHEIPPASENIRSVIRVLDPVPVANNIMLKFWSWISDYYMCSQGEVVRAAIPSILFLEGETSAPVLEKYKPREESFIEPASVFSDKELNEIYLINLQRHPNNRKPLRTG